MCDLGDGRGGSVQIADELGRHPSTVRREINRREQGGFEPRMLKPRSQGVLRSRNWSPIRSWPL